MKQRITSVHREKPKPFPDGSCNLLGHDFFRAPNFATKDWFLLADRDQIYFWAVADYEDDCTYHFNTKDAAVNFCLKAAAEGYPLDPPYKLINPRVTLP